MKRLPFIAPVLCAGAGLGLSTAVASTTIQVTFSGSGPTGFAPLFAAFHDGSYDTFDPGSAASANLETLAEVGNPAGLIGDGGGEVARITLTVVPEPSVSLLGGLALTGFLLQRRRR